MFRTLLCLLALSLASPAAADTLLAELWQQAGRSFMAGPSPERFLAGFQAANGQYVGFEEIHTDAEVGLTFWATEQELAAMRPIAASPGAWMYSAPTHLGAANHKPVADLWIGDYYITAMSITIDEFTWVDQHNPSSPRWFAHIEQTARVYGVPVPEPASWFMLLVGGAHLVLRRRV